MTAALPVIAPGGRARSDVGRPLLHVLVPVLGALLGVVGGVFGARPPLAVLTMGSFCFVLGHIAIVDLRERRIPNAYTYAGTAAGLLIAAALGQDAFQTALLGSVTAGGAMLLVYLAGRGRMGLGDVKLSAFIGAVIGVQAVPAFLVLSSLFGMLAALYTVIRTGDRRSAFAYGPALALAGALLALAEWGGM